MNQDLQKALEAAAANGNQGPGVGTYIFAILVGVVMIAAMWKVFTKAGKPGWASIIPIYNMVVLLDIAGKPVWWIILFFIPIVNFIFAILTYVGLAEQVREGRRLRGGAHSARDHLLPHPRLRKRPVSRRRRQGRRVTRHESTIATR